MRYALKSTLLAISIVAILLSIKSNAGNVYDTLRLKNKLVMGLSQGEFSSISQVALDQLIQKASFQLEKGGFDGDAKRVMWEWFQFKLSMMFDERAGTEDVGDHEPLFDWLEDLYVLLEDTVGTDVMKEYYLTDIRVFNFTIPVVYQPTGDQKNGDSWDKDEYRRHFVPYAGASTYWITIGACMGGSEGANYEMCQGLALRLRMEMEGKIAPILSDQIYDRANQSSKSRFDFRRSFKQPFSTRKR